MASEYVFKPNRRPALMVSGISERFPVHRIYCVGQNYEAHAREMGQHEREPPFFFSKPPDAVTQKPKVAWPPMTSNLHHEVELVVAIGSDGRDIEEEEAYHFVYGYAVGVDLTRRDLQNQAKDKRRPWDTSKGFDESAPVSKINRARDCGHPIDNRISLSVDGVMRQQGRLSDMIWSVPEIIAELSRYFTLSRGDLIFTGTPEGVSALSRGSQVRCEVKGIATHAFELR